MKSIKGLFFNSLSSKVLSAFNVIEQLVSFDIHVMRYTTKILVHSDETGSSVFLNFKVSLHLFGS